MDPFNAIVENGGILKYLPSLQKEMEFHFDVPELRRWRREGLNVEMRMVRVDYDKVCHAWPLTMEFCANGVEVFTIRPPEGGHKRRDVPSAITAGLKLGFNAIVLRMTDDRLQDFAAAIVLTTPRTGPDLTEEVGRCEWQESLARVRTLMAQQSSNDSVDEDITCLSSNTLGLRCPLSMERLQDPVRGRACRHLQCFGLSAYLQSNRQMRAFNNRWVCPVCTLVLRPGDLVRDTYVERVLAAAPELVDEVFVSADGSWRSADPAPEAAQRDSSPEALDLDDDDDEAIKPSVASNHAALSPPHLQAIGQCASGSLPSQTSPVHVGPIQSNEDVSLLEFCAAEVPSVTQGIVQSADAEPAPPTATDTARGPAAATGKCLSGVAVVATPQAVDATVSADAAAPVIAVPATGASASAVLNVAEPEQLESVTPADRRPAPFRNATRCKRLRLTSSSMQDGPRRKAGVVEAVDTPPPIVVPPAPSATLSIDLDAV